ncbi:MAG: hypothetical protein FJY98_04725 [Candidatus Liptonbacteria bacterium]|nr:hypothetical protein [Candidatus Liptonbacteria bacterium]
MAHVYHLGPKLIGNARQHTIIEYAKPFLYRIGQWKEVKRIGGGPISAGRSARGVKVWEVDVGLKIKIYDTIEAQRFFLYTDDREAVKEKLQSEFELCEFIT